MELTHIKFDHTAGDTADGIDIRENNSTDITVPEWVKDGQNKPAAYKKSTSVTVKARFTVSPTSVTSAKIRATTSDTILGNLGEQTVSFSNGVSNPEYISFTPANSTPSSVGKGTVTWQWKVKDLNGTGSAEVDINSSGAHTIYTVLTTPKTPMAEPWTEVLDKATEWATGAQSAPSVFSDVTAGINGWSVSYGGGNFWNYPDTTHANFKLTNFLNQPETRLVNCYDCADLVTIYSAALGCDIGGHEYSTWSQTRWIRRIGDPWPENSSDFGWYDGELHIGTHGVNVSGGIYDATYLLSESDDPDTPPTGGGILVAGMSLNAWKSLLILDVNNWTDVGGFKCINVE